MGNPAGDNGVPDDADVDGVNALIHAATQGDRQRVKALLGGGANLNQTDEGGLTALGAAAWEGNIEVVQGMLAQPGVAIHQADF